MNSDRKIEVLLEGQFLTPVVTKRVTFYLEGCEARLKKGVIRRRYYSKINTGKAMYPYSFICYLGTLQIRFQCSSKAQAQHKLTQLIKISHIGRYQSEGLGLIQWNMAYLLKNKLKQKKSRRLKIRKGLPQHLPQHVLDLIKYGILHDFFHNNLHKSKIYVEPLLKNQQYMEMLRDHHENGHKSKFIEIFQHYDRLASSITRKIRSPRSDRYNWRANKKIDFQLLANQISEVSDNVWKLYRFIYQSKELDLLNESFLFGHTSLRLHLLFITNLIVFDYLNNTLRKF